MSTGNNLSVDRPGPVVDFTSADFDALRADFISYAQGRFSGRWTDFNDDQFAIVLTEILAYLGDLLTYQLNATIREAFSATVLRRQNLANLGKTFDYTIPSATSAQVDLLAELDVDAVYPFTIPITAQFSNGGNGDDRVIFQPINPQTVTAYNPAGYSFTAIEGELFQSVLIGVSTGAPNQRWQFPQDGIVIDSITVTVAAAGWTLTRNFTNAQSSDTFYRIIQNDDGGVYLLFGDGTYGALPATGAEIRATFRVGGGRRGIVNPDVITTKVDSPSSILSITNPLRSAGGDDALPMKAARKGIPAALATLDRGVTTKDYESLAEAVSGVAKARSGPGRVPGAREIQIWAAASGGGPATATLKSSISSTLRTKKMVTNRIRVSDPVFKDLRFVVLLHVNPSYRASDVLYATRRGILNPDLTGMLDFPQLEFSAVSVDTNGNEELLLAQTRLQQYFSTLRAAGLDRAEIMQLDATPVPRVRSSGNSGNGEILDIVTTSRQRRREFVIDVTSAGEAVVSERIVGRVTGITDTTISDDEKVFENEKPEDEDFSSFMIVPYRGSASPLEVVSAEGQTITTSGSSSLFSMTDIRAEYYMYPRVPVSVAINAIGVVTPVRFTSSDGNVSFYIQAGTSPFVAGDQFVIDVFPLISDIRLRDDEYPQLSEGNFITRTSGGSRV